MKENNKHSVYAETETGSSQFFGIFTSKKNVKTMNQWLKSLFIKRPECLFPSAAAAAWASAGQQQEALILLPPPLKRHRRRRNDETTSLKERQNMTLVS